MLLYHIRPHLPLAHHIHFGFHHRQSRFILIIFFNCITHIVTAGKVVYGVNTGFGNFADVIIPNDKLVQLQENLIRSHSAGIALQLFLLQLSHINRRCGATAFTRESKDANGATH
jgi:hypothetical protein